MSKITKILYLSVPALVPLANLRTSGGFPPKKKEKENDLVLSASENVSDKEPWNTSTSSSEFKNYRNKMEWRTHFDSQRVHYDTESFHSGKKWRGRLS